MARALSDRGCRAMPGRQPYSSVGAAEPNPPCDAGGADDGTVASETTAEATVIALNAEPAAVPAVVAEAETAPVAASEAAATPEPKPIVPGQNRGDDPATDKAVARAAKGTEPGLDVAPKKAARKPAAKKPAAKKGEA